MWFYYISTGVYYVGITFIGIWHRGIYQMDSVIEGNRKIWKSVKPVKFNNLCVSIRRILPYCGILYFVFLVACVIFCPKLLAVIFILFNT
ncbi:unnamed protein product [Callosobruchus maculatus]|uniref:Uncharacterized protein n=1 Tax=Callosobruchus maculatus TaxID=64391 RepID=A0A653DQ42_CALMS|nr:unnamed protein product [Callosobruchus maculatus]